MKTLQTYDATFREDPYGAMREVREDGPVCRVEPLGFLGITRYDDVVAVLKNPKLFSNTGIERAFPPIKGAETFSQRSRLIGDDPPDHTRVRRLVQRAFTVQSMAAWEPRVEALTKALVDDLVNQPSFDLIDGLAIPLPVTVIAEMLGVDPARHAEFKRWSDVMIAMRSIYHLDEGEERQRREREVTETHDQFNAYFEKIIAERRQDSSGDDLISAMVRSAEEGDCLQPQDVLGLTRVLLIAGNETTTNLLGNAMTALLQDRDQWTELCRNPELAVAATEEALRFDGPVIYLTRRATEETQISGVTIPADTIIAPLVASANRDPRYFADPDKFDIKRHAKGHLAFGLGIHLCIGAPLARMEMRFALQQLATRLPDLHLVHEKPDLLKSSFLRGHRSLVLRRGSAASRPTVRHEDTMVY